MLSEKILQISWLLADPDQKIFRSWIVYRHVFQPTKKPSHATLPLRDGW